MIWTVLAAHARSDAAMAAFTLTSAPRTAHLGVKLLAAGAIFGLAATVFQVLAARYASPVRKIALIMVSNLRIEATKATFFGLPAASRRW